MVVAKSLELAVSPGVKDPVLGVEPGILSLVLRLVPETFDLVDQGVLGSSGALLRLGTLLLEVVVQLVRVPATVRSDGIAVPVALDQLLEVLAVSRCGVRNIVVREPALKLRLVPFIVGCWGVGVSSKGRHAIDPRWAEDVRTGFAPAAAGGIGHKGQGEESLDNPHFV